MFLYVFFCLTICGNWNQCNSYVFLSNKVSDVGRIDHVSKHRKQPIKRPECIHKNNAFMGGVDLVRSDDEVWGAETTTVKWWKKGYFHVLSLTVSNACILYNSLQARPKRSQLVGELVKKGLMLFVLSKPEGDRGQHEMLLVLSADISRERSSLPGRRRTYLGFVLFATQQSGAH